jgi:hypothetical protein
MKKLLLAFGFALWSTAALAQNVQCTDRPSGDNSNACANTRFVQQYGGGSGGTPGGNSGDIQYNNAGSFGGYPQVPVPNGGTGAATFTSGAPIVGNGTSPVSSGTSTGNTTEFATATGSLNAGVCVTYDTSGNIISSSIACAIYTTTSAIAGIASPTNGQIAYLSQPQRQGNYVWFSADVSSYVAPRSITSSSINTGTGVITTTANYIMKTGDSIIATSTVDGFTNNTRYYAIRITANTLKIASSYANALAGAAITITGTSTISFKVSPDSLQCTVIIPTGGALDGTGGAWLRIQSVNTKVFAAQDCGLNVGDTNDNAKYINVAQDIATESGGGKVTLPAGKIYMVNTLYPRRYVTVQGVGLDETYLQWYGTTAEIAVDALDDATDGAYPNDRTIFEYRDMTIDGSTASVSSDLVGFRLGRNYRSNPITNVRVNLTPGTGLLLDADNWNINITNLQLDTAGHLRSNAAGIVKNPTVTDLNYINFYNLMVEGCGNSSSAAGGLNITTTTLSTNRVWNFFGSVIEGNFGTDEVFFQNMTGIYFWGAYVESINTSGHTTGFEFDTTTGHIHGGNFAAQTGSPQIALKFTGNSAFTIMDIDFGAGWGSFQVQTNNNTVVGYGNLSGPGSNQVNAPSALRAMY